MHRDLYHDQESEPIFQAPPIYKFLRCPICVQPRNKRYCNEAAKEACVHPCHWPYLSAEDVAAASIALDKIDGHGVNARALREVWAA